MKRQEHLERLARKLVAAERDRQPLQSEAESSVRNDSEAYKIAELAWQIRGEPAVGFKLGFTSAVMREQMGVPTPNYGFLSASMELQEPVLDLGELIHPRFEPEIALLLERDLEGEPVTLNGVRRAVGWACAAIEVVDSRFTNYRFTAHENTADNSSAARFLLGSWVRLEQDELSSIGVNTRVDGEPIASGRGADAMGGPLHALHWLSSLYAARGKSVPAGSVVLTGGLTKAEPLHEGNVIVAEFSGLGTLQLRCRGRPTVDGRSEVAAPPPGRSGENRE